MFKISSFEEEIAQSMEKELIDTQIEKDHGINKLVQAAEFLNQASMIFETAGMNKEAEAVITIINSLIK